MTTPLVTAKDIADYHENGAVLIRNVLSAEAVGAFVEALDAVLARQTQTQRIGPNAVFVKQGGSLFFEFLSRDLPFFAGFLKQSAVASVVSQLLELDEVQFWRDEVHYKESGSSSNGTPWHHGIASIPFKGEQTPTVWLPMTAVSEDASPLQTIAGSHRHQSVRYRPPTRRETTALNRGYEDTPDFDTLITEGGLEVQTWTAQAGDAVIFHPYTVHGAPPNVSGRRRIAYVSRWMGEEALYQPDEYSTVDPWLDPATMIVDGRPSRTWFPPFPARR
ncbi:phytanoyl-CoA dioxygenase family protein [Myxococcus faecalis]|uniref:phytanoyl-CoA dioxygenase family protein n=1 Tax=Myxococcus faecalis TaxID=3115646 RepID=UPI003CF6F8C9